MVPVSVIGNSPKLAHTIQSMNMTSQLSVGLRLA